MDVIKDNTISISPNVQPGIIRYGWVCPRCNNVYNPDTITCTKCSDSNYVPLPSIPYYPYTIHPYYPYTYPDIVTYS